MAVWAQSAGASAAGQALEPGAKPEDISREWKQLVGIYQHAKKKVILFERHGALYWDPGNGEEWPLLEGERGAFSVAWNGDGQERLALKRDSTGTVTAVSAHRTDWTRVDAGADPKTFFQVSPLKSIGELRAEALKASPPVEAGPFRKPELVELVSRDPGFHLDIRYAHTNNFLSTPVYTQARAFLQRPAAEALVRVLHKLKPLGYGLLVHDAYRPWYVTKLFWDATPVADHIFVADPKKGSNHNRGCAVDITLYDLATGEAIEMPGLYDEMSPRSFANFPGGTSLQRWHRDLLRRAMESEEFRVNDEEWWHFDYKLWKQYGILNVAFEKLNGSSPAI